MAADDVASGVSTRMSAFGAHGKYEVGIEWSLIARPDRHKRFPRSGICPHSSDCWRYGHVEGFRFLSDRNDKRVGGQHSLAFGSNKEGIDIHLLDLISQIPNEI